VENQIPFKTLSKLSALGNHSRKVISDNGTGAGGQQYSKFYEFYQIDSHPPANETEGRSGREHGGLKSLWGSLWSVCTATGWTLEYLLWQITWINLQMMIVDAVRYNSDDEKVRFFEEPKTVDEIDQLMQKLKR
jgi:hypothetical protein